MSADQALVQSIRQRLENHARRSGEDIGRTLVRYGLERFLYRLSVSDHHNAFLLKGAMLFHVWEQAPFRATADLDLLGFGDNDEVVVAARITAIAAIDPGADDGVRFDTSAMAVAPLRLATSYTGVAVKFDALLGRARMRMQIDIGFGDAVTPGPTTIQFPTLLDQPAPTLRAYPVETVVAEKLEALVSIGFATTRIKDVYDLWAIATTFDFDLDGLRAAVAATFERRGTAWPDGIPSALSDRFAQDAGKQQLWTAFTRTRIKAEEAPARLADAITLIRTFTAPLLTNQEQVSASQWRREARSWLSPQGG